MSRVPGVMNHRLPLSISIALLGGHAFLGGLWTGQPWVQLGGVIVAVLSLLLGLMARPEPSLAVDEPWLDSRTAPVPWPMHEAASPTRAQHEHFVATYDRAQARAEALRPGATTLGDAIPTESELYRRLLRRIHGKITRGLSNVLLLGATGTGKTELARAIHNLRVSAGLLTGEFVPVNCPHLGAEPNLTVLFGYEKGAFTGALHAQPGILAQARGGTVFFDEVGDLNLAQQAVLLQVINSKTYLPMGATRPVRTDAALMFATLRDLNAMVERGEFRPDLLSRIETLTYTIPRLADRREDIPALVHFNLEVLSDERGQLQSFEPDALAAYLELCNHPDAIWPGNLRDVAASVERITLTESYRVTLADVEEERELLLAQWAQRKGWVEMEVMGRAAAAPVMAPAASVAPAPTPSARTLLTPAMEAAEEAELPVSLRGKLLRPDRADALVHVRACRGHGSLPDAAEYLYHGDLESNRKVKSERLRRQLAKYDLTFESAREGFDCVPTS